MRHHAYHYCRPVVTVTSWGQCACNSLLHSVANTHSLTRIRIHNMTATQLHQIGSIVRANRRAPPSSLSPSLSHIRACLLTTPIPPIPLLRATCLVLPQPFPPMLRTVIILPPPTDPTRASQVLIVVGIAISWVGSTQASESTYDAKFQARPLLYCLDI